MKIFRFKTYLTSNMEVLEPPTQELLSNCSQRTVDKGDYLLREGESTGSSYFVEDGLLRQFSIDEKGKEHILQFAPENWFVSNRESEYLNRPSSYFIQAIEDARVLVVERELIERLSKSNPAFIELNTRLLHRHIAGLQKRVTQLQSYTARERYLDFVRSYPDVLLRVPQTYVASYLGITPESLSRVRKELAKEQQVIS
ncbi:Crp/Fnr family transcriptional regulator [Galbibacter pacificus]|uniref:Crp/Fnr family transcriptional regulator n=1 Tax=Galbibacter pacificus TaxID=2996052 RepID=A0ABT6FN85_9FLAO|nr:Crp/Fnr family transcriptional regulator [Galbibacter pacificus]MDG3581242.1 Crp/Fnr family transcriptional regulator [Galbibacter pacificus]MDG3584720.1 Crp/Fnr family transcriptional regulator [Galbibacter pacificus]